MHNIHSMVVNRQIEQLLHSAEWMIEPYWGWQQLNGYLAQLDLMDKGAKYADLGFSEQRAQAKPGFFELAGTPSDGSSSAEVRRLTHTKLSGVMRMEDGSYTYGAKSLASFLRDTDERTDVVGHIIEINSGGGEALAGALMYETVKALKKPVHAIVHLAASAAYLTAVAADKIHLQSAFSSVGSIGVMASLDKEALELYRKNIMDVYASQSSEKNEEFRQLIQDGKTDLYVKRLDELATVFHAKVQASRPGVAVETLKGRVYIGDNALKLKLADGYNTMSTLAAMLLGGDSITESNIDNSTEEDMDDDDDFGTPNLSDNNNTTDMTLQQRLADQFLRILGINVPGTDAGMTQAVALMEGMSSQQEAIDSAVSAAVAPLNERLDDLSTRLAAALAEKAKPADNTELLARLATLEKAVADSAAENENLSKRVLDSANDEQGGDAGGANNYLTHAERTFGDRQRVTG